MHDLLATAHKDRIIHYDNDAKILRTP